MIEYACEHPSQWALGCRQLSGSSPRSPRNDPSACPTSIDPVCPLSIVDTIALNRTHQRQWIRRGCKVSQVGRLRRNGPLKYMRAVEYATFGISHFGEGVGALQANGRDSGMFRGTINSIWGPYGRSLSERANRQYRKTGSCD